MSRGVVASAPLAIANVHLPNLVAVPFLGLPAAQFPLEDVPAGSAGTHPRTSGKMPARPNRNVGSKMGSVTNLITTSQQLGLWRNERVSVIGMLVSASQNALR